MALDRRHFTLLAAGSLVQALPAQAARLDAPNVVEISPLLVTSGQPTSTALRGLSPLGFEAVVYLAPFTVSGAVHDEPVLLQSQGIEFVHEPIPFEQPTQAHFIKVSQHLTRLRARRTLVHCQVNMRASSMVFLHQVIALGKPPAAAYEAVSRVWSPHGPWLALLKQQLREHKVDFEPF